MRKLVALSFVLAIALIMGGCGLGKMVKKYPEVTVTLDNPDLENKGGEVAYTIKGTIPPKYMKKKATMTFTPSLSVDGEKVTPPFTTITLKGEKASKVSWIQKSDAKMLLKFITSYQKRHPDR